MSPSHNSDGLSSGQSFASSSPATSPVSSTDSSSCASSASSSASLAVTGAGGAGSVAVATGKAGGSNAAAGLNAINGTSNSSSNNNNKSDFYANAIDWNHFLPAPSGQHGVFVGPQGKLLGAGSEQRLQVHRAASLEQATHHHQNLHHNHHNHHNHHRQSHHHSHRHRHQQHHLGGHLAARAPRGRPLKGQAPAPVARGGQQQRLQFSMQLAGSPFVWGPARPGGAPPGRPTALELAADHTYNAPTADFMFASSSAAPGAPKRGRGRRPSKELEPSPMVMMTAMTLTPTPTPTPTMMTPKSNNHLKHNLSQQFFHKQATSPAHRAAAGPQRLELQRPDSEPVAESGLMSSRSPPLSSPPTLSPSVSSSSVSTLASCAKQPIGAHGGQGPAQRRVRGENRKCRKVYGMEQRELWCTQCKWKKACTRFCDE